MSDRVKVGVVSLGCDKNRVDSENMLGFLSEEFEIVSSYEEADVVIVNTCSFLQSAVKESIDVIMEAATHPVKIIVTGCLPMRYPEIAENDMMPEVSAFLDNQHYTTIVQTVYNVLEGKKEVRKNTEVKPVAASPDRILTTPRHYAYLKVAEGCNNRCAFCAIPKIRGPYVSTPAEELVEEAKRLVDDGVRELILVAQDVTRYRDGDVDLIGLIDRLEKTGVETIRLTYCYPEQVTEALLDRIERDEHLAKYIDVPMQHASDDVLHAMRRRSKAEDLRKMMDYIRRNTHIRVRSTFMVGFPGETEEDVDELVDFLVTYRIEYAGFFSFSREEGTPAYAMPQIPAKVKKARLKRVESVQSAIMREIAEGYVGKEVTVTMDAVDYDRNRFVGHPKWAHPEMDNKVYFGADFPVEMGCDYVVRIEKASRLDLVGTAKAPIE
ncbi:MAG: 30S ribosomal protein S12 methylthiotransferase RimO [Clostridia bacterium]|nr:30S ribosomal protein S12 methylthiotransferase RimO [Clostridia bacterium]